MTEMRVASVASGSKGNSYLVVQDGEALLIDCGVCLSTLRARVAALIGASGMDRPRLCGVLLTHSHSDHTSGLRPLLSKHDVPVYANSMTAESAARQERLDDSLFACFENGQPFEVGPFEVSAFSVPHDTSDPVGYLVRGASVYFHGTDIGVPVESVGAKLAEADVATLESNHDPVMLRTSGRPLQLVQRIAGPRGHLSNDDAGDLVRRYASPRLKRLALAHLSRDCNEPRLAERTVREALIAAGRVDVELKILSQDEPTWI
jgi:phosphoribosyl 1,2-cyclic phosphodiesterase